MKVCNRCGKEFEPTDPRQKYCSEQCALNAHNIGTYAALRRKLEAERYKWAEQEVQKLIQLDIDELKEYVYNNYRQRKGKQNGKDTTK